MNYQEDDKISSSGQNHYPESDDISELTPSLTNIDLEHQLMSDIEYGNMGSIQELLGDFESPSNQTVHPETIIESATICSSGIIGQ